ncbi:hypothetical protein M8998_13320 [Sphingobacterium sp. lm-10]|uniref:hypothetical protein n=1 Tax=Sphingobacterium sp. lm-10 TaxID=2944904 RepID=UPI0020218F87|nr:hypothetical protein [Sphingobacterium sp. lm-10]MCL7988924.1 hypothetical protein [Sphingobacterium sp. lm-10]
MKIDHVKFKTDTFPTNQKVTAAFEQFHQLIDLLNNHQIPDYLINQINVEIAELSQTALSDDPLYRLIKRKQSKIVKLVEKPLKIVPLNYYKNLWLVLGMTAFGLPIGTALGVSLGNIGLMGIGLPIGLAIGMAVGTAMDKKARDEGRQLDIALN